MKTQRKVPAGPKAQPGKVGHAASAVKRAKPAGIDPGKSPSYRINNTSRKHTSAVTGGSRNTPSGQGALSSKAKRQVAG